MMISFVNVLILPIISMAIFSRRFNKTIDKSFNSACIYAGFTVAIIILTYIVMKMLKFTIGIEALDNSGLYTIVATVVAFLLPYLYEIFKKYISIRCEIRRRDENSK